MQDLYRIRDCWLRTKDCASITCFMIIELHNEGGLQKVREKAQHTAHFESKPKQLTRQAIDSNKEE